MASWRWVRPILTIPSHSSPLAAKASARDWSAGTSVRTTSSVAATCMAVGKVSLDDWARLTWSLGWTGSFEPSTPPSIWIARLEITSLVFMFD